MTVNNNGWILTLFILIITSLALGYGFGVKARRLPFTAEIGYNQQQWQFLRWWVKLALVAGVLLPVLTRMVSPSPTLTTVAVRLLANTGNDI